MITGLTKGGTEWTPHFATELDQSKCIGCGRCYKVCPRNVLDLVEGCYARRKLMDMPWLGPEELLHVAASAGTRQ